MTYDEYVTKATSNLTAENALERMTEILECVKLDLEERDAFKASIDEKDTKIRDLQDTNMRLFLSHTGKPANDDLTEEPVNGEEFVNNMLKGVGAI